MKVPRRVTGCALSVPLLALVACAPGISVGEDAPRQVDACTDGAASEQTLYAAVVEGPAYCEPWERPGGVMRMSVYFTGDAWGQASADCRASSLWFGVLTAKVLSTASTAIDPVGDGVRDPVGTRAAPNPPSEAIGYCLIDEGEPTEYLIYATCGNQATARDACEDRLREAADRLLLPRWLPCPDEDDPRCPPAFHRGNGCVPQPGTTTEHQYATYIEMDTHDCGPDQPDALMVSLHPDGWNDTDFACAATQPHDRVGITEGHGSVQPGDLSIEAGRLEHSAMRGGLLPTPPSPPVGYCHVYPGTRHAYLVYSLCEPEPASGADPRERCEAGWRSDTGVASQWFDCPGGAALL